MKALIVFIVMAVGILALIEINERRKSRVKSRETRDEDCQQNKPEQGDCSGCGLLDVCDKKEKHVAVKRTKGAPRKSAKEAQRAKPE